MTLPDTHGDSLSSDWSHRTHRERCDLVGAVSGLICDRSEQLIAACATPQRTDPVETITSELFPLCAALDFIRKRGPRVLAPRRLGLAGRPVWLFGVRSAVHRVPLGDVLVLGTWNYPLLLPGVQIAQALAAGNRVQFKPAVGTEHASELLVRCFLDAGVPEAQLRLLSSETAAATEAMEHGVDLVVLTGSAETGRKVLSTASGHLTSSIMELSGCDAVLVLPEADLERLVTAISFGLRFNGGATCIGPRRLLVPSTIRDQVVGRLVEALREEPSIIVHPAARHAVAGAVSEALDQGAKDLLGRYDETRLRETGEMHPLLLDGINEGHAIAAADLFAPVLSVMECSRTQHAVEVVNRCPYRLAASVFGPRRQAESVARELDVGCVTVNDLIMPTADPRLPFGGRGQSGFGVTRGAEGLLAMTTSKAVCVRRGKVAPHLRPRDTADRDILEGALHWTHANSLSRRWAGLRRIVAAVKNRGGGN